MFKNDKTYAIIVYITKATWAGTQSKKQQNGQLKPEGSRDYIKNISLYDHNNKRIGNIYPRRAKQLILKGRAHWLKEGQTLQIIDSSSTTNEEETPMIDTNVYPTNGDPMIFDDAMPHTDDLLLYKAKQNVKNRRNLLKHILAFVAAWPILLIFYASTISNMVHSRWWRISNQLQELYNISQYLPEEHYRIINNLSHTVSGYFRTGHTPGIWYMMMGAMLAWGGWIAVRFIKIAILPLAKKLRKNVTKKAKPDPIIQEYNRLKSMAE